MERGGFARNRPYFLCYQKFKVYGVYTQSCIFTLVEKDVASNFTYQPAFFDTDQLHRCAAFQAHLHGSGEGCCFFYKGKFLHGAGRCLRDAGKSSC